MSINDLKILLNNGRTKKTHAMLYQIKDENKFVN